MGRYGLIGYPLSHSFSPSYFARKFANERIADATYSAFEIKHLVELKELLKSENISGFNVTIPHKQTILPYLDFLDISAEKIGAVNCIKVVNGKLFGYNTDHIAFKTSINPLIQNTQKALVFGNGGSSLAVKYALQELGIAYKTVSRSSAQSLRYDELSEEEIREFEILINTTPVGMYPNIENCIDIPYQGISVNHVCFDLVYNPTETLFLKKAKTQGATIKNGLEMLEIQADKSWDIWNS